MPAFLSRRDDRNRRQTVSSWSRREGRQPHNRHTTVVDERQGRAPTGHPTAEIAAAKLPLVVAAGEVSAASRSTNSDIATRVAPSCNGVELELHPSSCVARVRSSDRVNRVTLPADHLFDGMGLADLRVASRAAGHRRCRDHGAETAVIAVARDACALTRAGIQPAQAKGAKWPLRVPVESFHLMPKTLNRLRVALASDSRLFTGCAVLSTPIA